MHPSGCFYFRLLSVVGGKEQGQISWFVTHGKKRKI
nr:MAG TPA: hypothetical protein [Caudoviricetes sp.]